MLKCLINTSINQYKMWTNFWDLCPCFQSSFYLPPDAAELSRCTLWTLFHLRVIMSAMIPDSPVPLMSRALWDMTNAFCKQCDLSNLACLLGCEEDFGECFQSVFTAAFHLFGWWYLPHSFRSCFFSPSSLFVCASHEFLLLHYFKHRGRGTQLLR